MSAVAEMVDAVPAKRAWPTRPLGKVVTFVGGGTPSKQRNDYWGGDIPWVSPKDMKSDVVTGSIDKITPAAVDGSAVKFVPTGALLVVVRSGILARTIPTALTGATLTINQDLKALVPAKELDVHFLAHFMRSAERKLLASVSRGATVHRLATDALKSLAIPLPPLEEQKRIVAVLDQAFAALDRARAHAEANLTDAGELLENSLNAIFQKLATTSPVAKLEDAVHGECKLSYGIVQPGDDIEGGLPVVRPVDLKRRVITLSGLKLISPDRATGYGRTKLVGGELLLSVRGRTGELSIASPELTGGNVTRGIVPIRFAADEILPEFAYFQMRSRYVRDQIAAKTYGAALMQINIKDVRQIRFIAPTIPQQRAVVEYAEGLDARSRMLQSSYERKLGDIVALRQSLLQKAFAGELT